MPRARWEYSECGRGNDGAAAKAQERASALRMMAMVLAGASATRSLWWATVHSTAASLASQARLLLAVLCSPSEPQTSSTGARRPSTGSRLQSFADRLS